MEKELKEIRLQELVKEYEQLVNDSKEITEMQWANQGQFMYDNDRLNNLDVEMAENLDEQESLKDKPEIRFMYNGLKIAGKLYKASYSKGSYTELSGLPEGTLTIYAKDYSRFPRIEDFEYHNETDSQTDYFDNDKIRIRPDHPLYEKASQGYLKQVAHSEKVNARRNK